VYLRKVETLVLGQLSSRSLACKLKYVLRGNKHVIKTKALYLRLKHQIIALSPFSSLCKCHNPRVGVSDFLWTSGTVLTLTLFYRLSSGCDKFETRENILRLSWVFNGRISNEDISMSNKSPYICVDQCG